MNRFKAQVFLIMAIVISMITVTPVFATHLWTGHKWTRVNSLIYYCVQPGMDSNFHNAITQAASHINGWVGQFELREKVWDDKCVNHITIGTLSSTGCNGGCIAEYKMYYYDTSSTANIKSADIIISQQFKSQFTFSGCTTPGPDVTKNHWNVIYVLHHEFGHWMEAHHAGTAESSVMVPFYDCTRWNSFKSHDISSFNTIYPTVTTLSAQSVQGDTDDTAIKAGAKSGPHHFEVDGGGGIGGHIQRGAVHENNGNLNSNSDSHHKPTFDSIAKAKEKMQRLRNANNQSGR